MPSFIARKVSLPLRLSQADLHEYTQGLIWETISI